ncbi:MAG: hypothetical protein WCK21_00320 [Actinomycetota bacterium]
MTRAPADTVQVASQSGTDSGTVTPDAGTGTPPAGHADPASLPNGPGETVLTGDALAKVTAAAVAAEPGSTVIRAETGSSGHAYEAHVKLADGTVITLYFNASFAADGSDTGFGPGAPGGQDGHHGRPPVAPPASSNG